MHAPLPRLTIVQYAGDFREVSLELTTGGAETYRGQQYTVDAVEELVERFTVTVIVALTKTKFDQLIPSGVRVVGAGFSAGFDERRLVKTVKETRPDILILRSPTLPIILWAALNRCRTMMLIADSFSSSTVKGKALRVLFRWVFALPNFEIIANHGLAAAKQLVSFGVTPSKVIAWDYPAFDSPVNWPVKTSPCAPSRVLYVGPLTLEKGVNDIVEAAAVLKSGGSNITFELIGHDADGKTATLATLKGVSDVVRCCGVVPNNEIISRMAKADIIVVPSRRSYPEGFPLTIYEALCSRTPLIVSDHPMFTFSLTDQETVLVFPSGDYRALVGQILSLVTKPDLYAKLSEQSLNAWERLQVPVKWHAVLRNWLDGTESSRAWLRQHSLAS